MKTKIVFSILGLILLLTIGIFSSCNSEKENKEDSTSEITITEEIITENTNKEVITSWSDKKLGLSVELNDEFIFQNNSEFVMDGPLFSRETGIFETKMVASNKEKNKFVSIIAGTNMNISKNNFIDTLKSSYNDWTNVEYTSENILGKNFNGITITQTVNEISIINHIYIAETENNSIVMLYIAYPENIPEAKTEILSMFN